MTCGVTLQEQIDFIDPETRLNAYYRSRTPEAKQHTTIREALVAAFT